MVGTVGEDQELDSLPLELAATRPQMIWAPILGAVPTEAAAILFVVFGITVLSAKVWWTIFPCIVAWWVVAQLISRDFHAITLVKQWLGTSAWTFDADREGGAGPTPTPLFQHRARGM